MKFENMKIQPSEISAKGVVSAPDRLSGTASENKAVFDRLVKELVAEKFNGFVDLVREEMEAIELPPAGEPGYTPQKGVDYWTEADKAEIEEELLNTLREGDIADINEELFHLEEALAELSAKAYFLNFAIYGGVNVPENPGENDIWINTDTEITKWIFSVTEPDEAQEGMVWITIGEKSPVAFNSLTDGCIMVYPIAVAQYIGGEWVVKIAKTYRDGKWVAWVTFLYNSGDECEELTNGWEAAKLANTNSGVSTYIDVGVVKNEASITISLAEWGNTPHGNAFKTVEAIDLTDVKTITANIEGTAQNQYERILFMTYSVDTSKISNDGANTSSFLRLGGSGDYTIPLGDYSIDVSALSGRHYVGFYLYNTGGTKGITLTINKVWME